MVGNNTLRFANKLNDSWVVNIPFFFYLIFFGKSLTCSVLSEELYGMMRFLISPPFIQVLPGLSLEHTP
jgi:hypothetical protein